MTRELLFSVTKKDFRVEYMRGSGKGGQKRNKTSSACRITHPDSGAVGYAEDTRSQSENRERAFMRMFHSPEYQAWYKVKCGRVALTQREVDTLVRKMMRPENLRVEVFRKGEWVAEDSVS